MTGEAARDDLLIRGALELWGVEPGGTTAAREDSPLGPVWRVTGPDAFRDPGLRRIALANPALAPYGRAALEAARALGVEDIVRDRQVIGQNVSQAHQFVRTGNAELGFLALSQVVRSADGSRWLVPEHLHAPIRQQAVLLEAGHGNPAAARFLDFLGSSTAREILRRHGYRTEQPRPGGRNGP